MADRLFSTMLPVFDGPDGHERETGLVRVAVDLEEVVAVRESVETPGRCSVYFHSGPWLLDCPYETVLAAWEAYRRHADRDDGSSLLARIRN